MGFEKNMNSVKVLLTMIIAYEKMIQAIYKKAFVC